MGERLESSLRELARRAGLSGVPPAALGAAIVLCAVVVVLAAWRWWPRDGAAGTDIVAGSEVGVTAAGDGSQTTTGSSAGPPAGGGSELSAAEATSSASVYVHIVGAVRHPGLYELATGARVADAVDAAGGLLGDAAQAGVNLARPVADGEQIAVPTADEFARGAVGQAAVGSAGGGTPGASGAAGAGAGTVVNINTADAAALDALPGVGPSTAAKIVADREANGPFASADDLGRVAGIGPKKLEELKPRVCVR